MTLTQGTLSDWVSLSFQALPGVTVKGLTRLLVIEMGDHFSLYLSPINLDPDAPAMPISHPPYYATYLAKKLGPYSTLGLAEDTWALNEGVTDDKTFLQQTYDIDREREDMFFAALDRLRAGTLVCVFDATDRIQHMFWRDIDPAHPAAPRPRAGDHAMPSAISIATTTRWSAACVQQLGKDDVLMVISDHGFTSFRRGVNLNQWLLREGYLTLKPGADGRAEWLRDVDWSGDARLRARAHGHVPEPEGPRRARHRRARRRGRRAEAGNRREIAADCETTSRSAVGVNEAFDTAALYSGPYLENAPDFVIGYNAGYRISWDCATGVVAGPVFEDNRKPWSGDHCIDPRLVPGVFFCNRKVDDRGTRADRHRADRAAVVRHRAAALHGRPAAGGDRVRRFARRRARFAPHRVRAASLVACGVRAAARRRRSGAR